jgi:hypothetical protein
MERVVKRGFVPTDATEFGGMGLTKLKEAVRDTCYLLNRGFENSGVVTFVGNHYQLTERQRLALMRGLAADKEIEARAAKELHDLVGTVLIDGFNTFITLEVALSGSLVLQCADGTLRDLAGLHGSFRIVDKTVAAVDLVLKALSEFPVTKAIIYLDQPVSNSGRLKQLLESKQERCPFELEMRLLPDVDKQLTHGENVVTSDSIILNNCQSWFNLNKYIVQKYVPKAWIVKIS